MREMYVRGPRERRSGMFPSIYVFPKGLQLNKSACEDIGFSAANMVKWAIFYFDKKRPGWYGFMLSVSPQKHMESVYKATFQPARNLAKINCGRFVQDMGVLKAAMKLDKTTYPLMKTDEGGEILYWFEIK